MRKDPIQAYCLFEQAALIEKKAGDEIVKLNQKLSAEQVAKALQCAKAARH